MKKIVLTGGGSAGHVTPNLALIPTLQERGYEIHYIGSHKGIERKLIESSGIPYYPISTGKLRRYFSLQNFTDPFRVIHGLNEAGRILKKIKPDILFSKGGFVALPVVRAAAKLKIPIIAHESDITPGLANRLSLRYVNRLCCNFPETMEGLPEDKAVLTGTPIRAELNQGDRVRALGFTCLSGKKPVLMIIGGSLGAGAINDAVRDALPTLLTRYDIVHLCGKGKVDETLLDREGYCQYEYISEELPDLFELADIVISRAGANAICELAALHKPNLLIPLSIQASRGDQILNAQSFENRGFSMVLYEEDMTTKTLIDAVDELYEKRDAFAQVMREAQTGDAVRMIADLIDAQVK